MGVVNRSLQLNDFSNSVSASLISSGIAAGLIGLTKELSFEPLADRLRADDFEIPDARRFRLCARFTRS